MALYKFDDRLVKFLEKEAAIERYKKLPKIIGIVVDKKTTRNDNIVLVIRKGNADEAVLVNKNNEKLYDLANKVNLNNKVFACGTKGIKVLFCEELRIIEKHEQAKLV